MKPNLPPTLSLTVTPLFPFFFFDKQTFHILISQEIEFTSNMSHLFFLISLQPCLSPDQSESQLSNLIWDEISHVRQNFLPYFK